MDRLEAKHDMLIKLGRLFGPLERLIETPENFDEQERDEILARYFAEHRRLEHDFVEFCKGQSGHVYTLEARKFVSALSGVSVSLGRGKTLKDIVPECLKIARDAIQSIPVPRSSVILEAGTPFTAYCRLRSLCEADAKHSLMWFDPYFGESIFHRYLQFVNKDVAITLVASEPGSHAGRANRGRWDSFLDISRLFATERGHDKYRLVIAKSLHDRWLALDKKRIYSLGGSAKDAASNDVFTITSIDPSPTNLKHIDNIIDNGEEWFGPANPNHR